MTLLTPRGAALDRVFVALDLETTGLDPNRDHIIEVGAVKFQGSRTIETLETYVNPYTPIPHFVQRLTGIRQRDVEAAPPFAVVAGSLAEFVGSLPLIGHNVSFDLQFLAKHGLSLSNTSYDTWDLAAVLLPTSTEYSLPLLARDLGINHKRPHRALDDAQITRRVFLALLERLEELDPAVSSQVRVISDRARWPFGDLLDGKGTARATVGLGGIDVRDLESRLARPQAPRRPKESGKVDEAEAASLASAGGLLSRSFPAFEHRPQQVAMLSAVTRAYNEGNHLIVEGGTGVGKSVAYLVPSILFAVRTGARVVVSTNTINLQEQLLQKDIPALVKALEEGGVIPAGEVRAVSLKGRANYLCVRRWSNLSRSDGLSVDEARLLSKCLVWLQSTRLGDRAELNLAGRDGALWGRVSAGDKGRCLGLREGACFLRAARERAEAAHVVVVNHALLLSDLARGGTLIPEYQHLIIDEAHHLEDEATRQMGFQVSQDWLVERLEDLSRWLAEIKNLLGSASLSEVQRRDAQELVGEVEGFTSRLREAWGRLWAVVEEFIWNHRSNASERVQLRITRSTRVQPGWSEVEVAWENCHLILSETQVRMEKLHHYLDLLPLEGMADPSTVLSNLETWLEDSAELRDRLHSLVDAPAREDHIDWITQGDDSTSVLHSAPLDVGTLLKKQLFDQKECVVLTSATLSIQGTFQFIRQRLGLEEADEMLVGSPFNYKKAAFLAIPEDIPEPGAVGYRETLERGLGSIVKAAQGYTMVLFTSHAALRAARQTLIDTVEPEGIPVLAQGVDGPPHRVLRSFTERPQSVLLGTSSFWEGVDLPSGVLRVLVLARLPFNVPTEPTFAARAEQYEDPFGQYAVPQAVLRFRQGFGRLIRNSRDQGAVIVLDRRILGKSYGRAFLDSLPSCTVKTGPLAAIPEYVSQWLRPNP